MTSKGITGLLAIALATVALVLLFFVIGSAQGATKYDGGGPGSTLPACTSAYWGFTINLFGRKWYCAPNTNYWKIIG